MLPAGSLIRIWVNGKGHGGRRPSATGRRCLPHRELLDALRLLSIGGAPRTRSQTAGGRLLFHSVVQLIHECSPAGTVAATAATAADTAAATATAADTICTAARAAARAPDDDAAAATMTTRRGCRRRSSCDTTTLLCRDRMRCGRGDTRLRRRGCDGG